MERTYLIGDKEVFIRLGFPIKIEKDTDGSYLSSCPILKGCHSSGETEYLAKENMRNAIKAYIQSMVNHQESLPVYVLVR